MRTSCAWSPFHLCPSTSLDPRHGRDLDLQAIGIAFGRDLCHGPLEKTGVTCNYINGLCSTFFFGQQTTSFVQVSRSHLKNFEETGHKLQWLHMVRGHRLWKKCTYISLQNLVVTIHTCRRSTAATTSACWRPT